MTVTESKNLWLSNEFVNFLACTNIMITRAFRGSDYSPAIVLSEEKDKSVTENWRERKVDQ